MELRLLTTFLKVAQLQSFSKAAESLGYSQSAVTVQVQQLENELGVRLFDRIGKTVSITHYGLSNRLQGQIDRKLSFSRKNIIRFLN